MKLHMIAFILLVIGGVNWLLVGIFGWDIGEKILGGMSSPLSRIVYILVGLSAVYEIATHGSRCKDCDQMRQKKAGGQPGQNPM